MTKVLRRCIAKKDFVCRFFSLQPYVGLLSFNRSRSMLLKDRSNTRSNTRSRSSTFNSFWSVSYSILRLMQNTDDPNKKMASRRERFLLVGLGNAVSPDTRHSVGMMAMDTLMTRLGADWDENVKRVYDGTLGKSLVGLEDCELTVAEIFAFKPKTLMNINGRSVLKAAKQLDVAADRIYLVHDELDKAVGKCSLKEGGSARGHRGVLSCYEYLRKSSLWPQSDNGDFKGMPRLRIGIGRPTRQSQVVSHVLSPFKKEEVEKVHNAIDQGLDLLLKHMAARMAVLRQSHGEEHT